MSLGDVKTACTFDTEKKVQIKVIGLPDFGVKFELLYLF